MFIKLFLITGVVVAVSFLAMGISVFFRKNGKFPTFEIGKNKDMRKLGITCAKHDELKCHNRLKKGNKGDRGSICETC
ncbi:hypothetical protein ES708_24863 [subsurface metagenome]